MSGVLWHASLVFDYLNELYSCLIPTSCSATCLSAYQLHKQTLLATGRQADIQAERQGDTQARRSADRQTVKQEDAQTADTQPCKQAN